jgi:hypothetical protein
MRRIFIFACLLVVASIAHGAEPVFTAGRDSIYEYTNGTLAVSSSVVTSFSAVTGYRKVTLTNSTSFFYRVDGSTSNIATTGFPVAANASHDIESSAAIHLLNPVGVATGSGRYIEKRK